MNAGSDNTNSRSTEKNSLTLDMMRHDGRMDDIEFHRAQFIKWEERFIVCRHRGRLYAAIKWRVALAELLRQYPSIHERIV